MSSHFMRVLNGVAATAALGALILAGAGPAGAAPTRAAAAPAAARVPGNFRPVSASFRSPALGVALGGVGCAAGFRCRARLAATADGGRHWRFLKTPDVRLSSPGNSLRQAARVSGVVFADRRNGWIYGPALYATHDGGSHWRRIFLRGDIVPSLGGGVARMVASAGVAWAVVSPDPFHGKADELYRSPAGRNAWVRVRGLAAGLAAFAVSGKAAWFAPGGGFAGFPHPGHLWATADGAHWHRYRFHCARGYGLASIAAASRLQVDFLCLGPSFTGHTAKEIMRSFDGGRTERLAGPAPLIGVDGIIAVPPSRAGVITLADSFGLFHSANGAKTWTQALFFSADGAGWPSLGFASRTVGWAVASTGHQLLRSTDAGRTWHRIRF